MFLTSSWGLRCLAAGLLTISAIFFGGSFAIPLGVLWLVIEIISWCCCRRRRPDSQGEPLVTPPLMPSCYHTQSSQQAWEQWKSDATRYYPPGMGIFAAFAHLLTRRAFGYFYFLVFANTFCIVYSPTLHNMFNRLFGILALINVIPRILLSLRHVILPWKATVDLSGKKHAFGLSLVLCDVKVGPKIWLCAGTLASASSLWSKMTGWGAIALEISSHKDSARVWAMIKLVLGIIMPLKEFFFSLPAPTKRHNAAYDTLDCCGPNSVAQDVKFEEADVNNVKGKEYMFCTFAEHFNLNTWCSTHYECFLRLSSALGIWFANSMSSELPLINILVIYMESPTLTQELNLRVLRHLLFILRQRVQSTILTTLLSALPKLLTQVDAFSEQERIPGQWPSASGMLAFLFWVWTYNGMLSGFLSFVLTHIAGYPTRWKIFKEFRRVQREWESSPFYSPKQCEEARQQGQDLVPDAGTVEKLRKDIQDELKSGTLFLRAEFFLELICGIWFAYLAYNVFNALLLQGPLI